MDIVHFYQVAAAKTRMFSEVRFSYLTSALNAATQLSRGSACHDPEYHRRVRNLNVSLYLNERAKSL